MALKNSKGAKANMNFLFGSVFFFFIILIIISLFSYLTLQQYWHNSDEGKKVAAKAKPRYDYSVRFDDSFKGRAYSLFLNDSLLYVGSPVSQDTVIRSARLADENSLIVVDGETDAITAIIELGRRGDVLLKYVNGEVVSDIKE